MTLAELLTFFRAEGATYRRWVPGTRTDEVKGECTDQVLALCAEAEQLGVYETIIGGLNARIVELEAEADARLAVADTINSLTTSNNWFVARIAALEARNIELESEATSEVFVEGYGAVTLTCKDRNGLVLAADLLTEFNARGKRIEELEARNIELYTQRNGELERSTKLEAENAKLRETVWRALWHVDPHRYFSATDEAFAALKKLVPREPKP